MCEIIVRKYFSDKKDGVYSPKGNGYEVRKTARFVY